MTAGGGRPVESRGLMQSPLGRHNPDTRHQLVEQGLTRNPQLLHGASPPAVGQLCFDLTLQPSKKEKDEMSGPCVKDFRAGWRCRLPTSGVQFRTHFANSITRARTGTVCGTITPVISANSSSEK